ncbi:MAG TPA: bifunctional 4-hydroxy-2-oxoglutarate aldolase/2-dehydro-3-deoxy-phosphogluconate aldolase [Anaerolineae bacterium]|nr:bifunctional 4-hydroxy-2-oxoglutarate aldolase/2-dehydro-3-deoxy-phosphogluconate aldolase [Anaerolineae bacterium]
MNPIFEQIGHLKLVPVVKIEQTRDALALGQALLAGGLPLAEITFRTEAAAESIRILSDSLPELLVGAGTVLSLEQVRQAKAAGASFIVAPGFSPKVVDYCLEHGIPVVPGVNSPTQVEMGLERGLALLKFFPAEASGGLRLLKAMAEPYGGVNFMPTGGIDAGNLLEYLAFKRVVACGGSWMVKAALISAGRFDEITRLTREAVKLVHSN